MPSTQDLNVRTATPLPPPREILKELPSTDRIQQSVIESRTALRNILHREDNRFLVVVGPCSIHDEVAAAEYAAKLAGLAQKISDRLFVVMRVYFEKPRTTIGWKGLINDPHLDGSFAIDDGLRKARRILLSVLSTGIPAATEMLDPIVPQYIADLVSWTAIGARTTESQTHREMASGLSMPVGFKNSTSGDMQIAVDAMKSSLHAHSFLGIDEDGRTAIVRTKGNKHGHIILRGGHRGPNYHTEHLAEAAHRMQEAGLIPNIMVDCSHANSEKKFRFQEVVWQSTIRQRSEGNCNIIGAMLESNLNEGSQPFQPEVSKLVYGVSITDACVGWEKTEEMLRNAHSLLAS